MLTTDILQDYQLQISSLTAQIKSLKKIINQYAYGRLALFLLAILLVYTFFNAGLIAVAVIALCLFLGFLILVKIQQKKTNLLVFKETKLKLLQNEIEVLNGGKNIYDDGQTFSSAQHAYTDDLDVFGAQSLFHYINRCVSTQAKALLASWLQAPAQIAIIEARQEAVKELTNLQKEGVDFRTRIFLLEPNLLNQLSNFIAHDLATLLQFLNSKSLKYAVRILPFINLSVLTVALLWGGIWWSILGIVLLLNGVFYGFFKNKIDILHLRVEKAANALDGYAQNLQWIERKHWNNALMKNLLSQIHQEVPLSLQLIRLGNILVNLNYRLNMLVGTFLNLFLQWDLRVLFKLQKWQNQYKSSIVNGFEVMVEIETLLSLSNLAHNHPHWIYPQISSVFTLESKALGHPLIPFRKRVSNDFSLAKHPTTDVITGSNMAGKSTFLRTVGANMVLAFAGAKVCATSFNTSVFNLVSYMRIKDSLQNQTSTFKAEIDRLKMILDFTQQKEQTFVLIDEMLRGTNSKDKYLGTKVFIKKLIAQKTPGFIATHDLQIADLEQEYPQQLRNFHFDIQLQENEMYFDYKIKKGKCETFNASLLLKAIGLNIDDDISIVTK
ncbi:MutS-related protein [Pedobacter glucosidilyticus]|uniref:MutS-related protein n=1 Tax=Pedobacter glucosidilyticus TaxID=1122941 RepID=UPI0004032851|nr:DNA mismatch repair protein MutS [Pedobacter glucosidilyticus]